MVQAEVAEDAGLNLYLLGVGLLLDFGASLQLGLREDVHIAEHLYGVGLQVVVQHQGCAVLYIEAATGCLLLPLLAVAVAVEADGLAGKDILANGLQDGLHRLCAILDKLVNTLLEMGQRLGHSGIEDNHRGGAVGLRTGSTELEAVTSKGKGRGAVAVGIIQEELGNLRNIEGERALALEVDNLLVGGVLQMVEQLGKLLAQEWR